MAKRLTKIREFFWPLLEPVEATKEESTIDPENSIEILNKEDRIQIADDSLDEAFKLNLRIVDNEEDRRKGIESKAALFISTISVATSVVVAANALVTGSQQVTIPVIVSVSISFILSIYAVRTVWFSIKTLERKSFHTIDFENINKTGSKTEYQKKMIEVFREMTRKNYAVVNSKMDFFTMAQEYYKRAIGVICIYSFLVLVFCITHKKHFEYTSKTVHIIMDNPNSFLQKKSNSNEIYIITEDSVAKKIDSVKMKVDTSTVTE